MLNINKWPSNTVISENLNYTMYQQKYTLNYHWYLKLNSNFRCLPIKQNFNHWSSMLHMYELR